MKNLLFLILFLPSILLSADFVDKGTTLETIVNDEKIIISKSEAKVTMEVFKGENFISVSRAGVFSAPTTTAKDVKLDSTKEIFVVEPTTNSEVNIDIVLKSKPSTNKFDFLISGYEEFDFFYQPELTQWEIDAGAFRPENVIGSFAVYHKTKKNNQYKTGKAFHIYRPKIIDNNGDWIWGDLSYASGVLTVTVDQIFLNKASYPVMVDPTFGNGADQATEYSGNGMASFFAAPEDGTITSISFRCRPTGNVNAGYYTGTSNGGYTANVAHGTSQANHASGIAWETIPVSGSITNGTSYWLSGQTSGGVNHFYDAVAGNFMTYSNPAAYDSWGTTGCGSGCLSGYLMSIYATYTAGGAGRTRRTIVVE